MTMVNAGHPHPAWKRADGSAEWAEIETGFPIGIVEGAEFEQETIELQPGERICLFTDGITEAMNPEQECFGEQRLRQAVAEASNSGEELVRHVQESIQEHVGDAKQSDDLTFICFGPEADE
jgi:sigma-B regulation protein RsbU (phosphoserine phosphatase)